MRKTLLTFAAGLATALISTAAMADGMIKGGKGGSMKDAPAPVAERCASGPFAGTFIGGHVGYAWGRSDHSNDSTTPNSFTKDEDGGFVGGIGYAHNWQCDRFVFGFAGDISFGDIDTHADYGDGDKITSTVNWFTTSRVRLGIAHDKTLFYVTAGLAYADLDWELKGCCTAKNSDREFGWTIGGGVEFLRDHWSLRAEVLYVDLGETNISYVALGGGGCALLVCSLNTKWDDSFLVARIGLSFKLGGREEQHTPMK